MLRRLTILALLVSFFPASAAAQSLMASVEREAKKVAFQITPAKNPYKVPAIALMAGGAGLLMLGLMQDRGAEVESGSTGVTVTEKGGSKTALTVLGIAAAGAGAGLWFWGENKKNRPNISMTPSRVQIGFRF